MRMIWVTGPCLENSLRRSELAHPVTSPALHTKMTRVASAALSAMPVSRRSIARALAVFFSAFLELFRLSPVSLFPTMSSLFMTNVYLQNSVAH